MVIIGKSKAKKDDNSNNRRINKDEYDGLTAKEIICNEEKEDNGYDNYFIDNIDIEQILDKTIGFEFRRLFKDLPYLMQKGKGYSIYNASTDLYVNLKKIVGQVFKSSKILCLTVSEFRDEVKLEKGIPVIIYQDLNYLELLKKAETLANKLIYPAWYMKCPIFFLSKIDLMFYNVSKIQSSLIHSDYNQIINLLSLEQISKLLSLVNVNITSPQLMQDKDFDIMYTPIEEIFKKKLVENNITFQPQVKLGRYYVDFLVEIRDRKIIVECDGREYHDIERDRERDKVISKEGYEIVRFSGSEIYNSCDECIKKLKKVAYKKKLSKYPLEDLNEEQIVAVKHINGPMRVLAPAGSGKTKTLVNRIVNLINNGVNESEILALAFNKKAEVEMTKRLSDRFGISNVKIRTFHSFGNEIIKKRFEWRFNADEQEMVTRKLLEQAVKKNTKLTYERNKDPLDKYFDLLSRVKNELLSVDEMIIEDDDKVVNFEPIFHEYLKSTSEHNFYNFDDMLYIALRILLSEEKIRRYVQDQYKYVLVDEFQDLNQTQLLLLQIITLPQNNLFIVGDDDQMIYGFRGAEIRHILQFDKRYYISKDQVLKINYRSCSDIVRHSKWLIDNNEKRVYKDIQPASKERNAINLYIGASLKDQAEKAAEWIIKNKNDNNKWSDFAILYRYNQYRDLIYLVLQQHNIPVHYNGIKVLNSSIGRCIFSYLTILINPKMSTANHYKEILNKPNKYFKNDFIKTITSWNEFIDEDRAKEKLRKMDIERYVNLVKSMKKLSSSIAGMEAAAVINTIIEEFGLKQFYKDQSKFSVDVDVASDYDILEIIVAFSENFDKIEDFYNYWLSCTNENSDTEDEDEKDSNKVILSTIHKTKGNEFVNVCYFNLSSNVTDRATESQLEEERRVAYVGVTRPKKKLLITSSIGQLSPFIKEYFLNPEYNGLSNETLHNNIEKLIIERNVLKADADKLDEKISTLTNNFPELNGENITYKGMFKNYRQKRRKIKVEEALKLYNLYSREKNRAYEKYMIHMDKIDNIDKELNYRKIINNVQ